MKEGIEDVRRNGGNKKEELRKKEKWKEKKGGKKKKGRKVDGGREMRERKQGKKAQSLIRT